MGSSRNLKNSQDGGTEPMEVDRSLKTPQVPKSAAKSGKKGSSSKRKKSVKRKKVEDNDSVQEADEYAVERIVDKKVVDGEVQYFIKWQGWPEDSNTWEPIEHLGNCHMMIQSYENKLASGAKKKQPAKRGRSVSAASSSVTSHSVGRPSNASRGKSTVQRNKRDDTITPYLSGSEDEDCSGVEDFDQDLTFGILYECPPGKELEKIHAVAVVDGYLTFLVQWKTAEAGDIRPPITNENANMVRAISMNKMFPQEVIAFYQSRVRFNLSLEPYEKEAVKAAQALVEARERRFALSIKRNGDLEQDDDAELDPATKAIEKTKRQFDPYDPNESDLSSSESDDDPPLEEDQ
ncbi:unnamed protein product [Allacma fusca]|uniref:Chromo domain-containing protein n=1 Tax=Allacma fusca TaxID=39272 RepID=A0A8J2LT20_9HEXA|nr:unnamed protein product [Allacma fusca]